MKLISLLFTLALVFASPLVSAAPDRSYYVTELVPQQKFDVYNDGQNTYLEAIEGLIVVGATADGEMFIVRGVPAQIRAYYNGKPITVIRGTPPPKNPAPSRIEEANARLKQLNERLERLASGSTTGNGPAAKATGEGSGPASSKRILVAISDAVPYRVAPADVNLRLALEKWAKSVGWTAVWDVEKDIPIGNAGETTADFKTSVRWLLSSTELGDLVVKPCFYNNSVVRAVRKTVKCNPND